MAFIRCEDCAGTGRAPCWECGGTAYQDGDPDTPCAFCIDGTEACDVCEGTRGYETLPTGLEDEEDWTE
jgi:hypothetical protein